MKFTKKSKLFDRLVDISTKFFLLAVTALICLWMISGAKAAEMVQIKEIDSENSLSAKGGIRILLSGEISKDSVSLNFERNFIQLSLKGVSAVPAKTKIISNELFDKVFSYQFQPDLARVRILLGKPASKVKDLARWELNGNILTISLKDTAITDKKIPRVTAEARTAPETIKKSDSIVTTSAAPKTPKDMENEAIEKNIILEARKVPAALGALEAKPLNISATPVAASTEDQPVFQSNKYNGGSSDSLNKEKSGSYGKMTVSLLIVLALIAGLTYGFKKLGLHKALNLNQQKTKVIEVISSQSLGAKSSVTLVKILDQYMVLGVTSENVNLLSNLGSNVDVEKHLDEVGPGISFSKALLHTMDEPESNTRNSEIQKTAPRPSMKSLIKQRLEGFKTL